MKAVNVDVNCPKCSMTFTPFPSLSPAIVLKEEKAELIKEIGKLQQENARLREALEWYAWKCEPALIQRSDLSGTLVLVENKEKALACRDEDKFIFGTKAREALKGGE